MKIFIEEIHNVLHRRIKELEMKLEAAEEEIQRRIIENARLHHHARTLWEENQKLKSRPPGEMNKL
jgi:predicted nuclease with TOPRIM domain